MGEELKTHPHVSSHHRLIFPPLCFLTLPRWLSPLSFRSLALCCPVPSCSVSVMCPVQLRYLPFLHLCGRVNPPPNMSCLSVVWAETQKFWWNFRNERPHLLLICHGLCVRACVCACMRACVWEGLWHWCLHLHVALCLALVFCQVYSLNQLYKKQLPFVKNEKYAKRENVSPLHTVCYELTYPVYCRVCECVNNIWRGWWSIFPP